MDNLESTSRGTHVENPAVELQCDTKITTISPPFLDIEIGKGIDVHSSLLGNDSHLRASSSSSPGIFSNSQNDVASSDISQLEECCEKARELEERLKRPEMEVVDVEAVASRSPEREEVRGWTEAAGTRLDTSAASSHLGISAPATTLFATTSFSSLTSAAEGGACGSSPCLEIEECRICKEQEGVLVEPCLCGGSMAKVHVPCLQEWLSKRVVQHEMNICEVCRTPYNFAITTTVPCTYSVLCSRISIAFYVEFSTVMLSLASLVYIVVISHSESSRSKGDTKKEQIDSDDPTFYLVLVIGAGVLLFAYLTLRKMYFQWRQAVSVPTIVV